MPASTRTLARLASASVEPRLQVVAVVVVVVARLAAGRGVAVTLVLPLSPSFCEVVAPTLSLTTLPTKSSGTTTLTLHVCCVL